MLLNIKAQKTQILTRIFSLIIGALGLYILWAVWWPVITKHRFDSFSDVFFLFAFPIPAACIAAYFFYTAANLWKGLSSKGIRKLAVSFSIIFGVLFLTVLVEMAPDILEEYLWSVIIAPFIIIISGLFYLFVKKGLFSLFSVHRECDLEAHNKAVKLYFGVLAFFIWSAVANMNELLPKKPVHEHLPDNTLLAGLIVFGSIPIAFLFYRFGLKLFLKKPSTKNTSSN